MGTYNGELQVARGNSPRGRQPYLVQNTIDIATTKAEKGTALAANDIIEAISVPANTLVIQAGYQVTTAMDASAAGCTMHLGFSDTHGAVDTFVTAFDIDAAAAGDYATPTDDSNILVETADTLDLELQAATTGPITGAIRVFAVLMDISDTGEGVPSEVARDALA